METIYPFSYFFDFCRILNHLIPESELEKVWEYSVSCEYCLKQNSCCVYNGCISCDMDCPIQIFEIESKEGFSYTIRTIFSAISLFCDNADLDLFEVETKCYKILRQYNALNHISGKKETKVGAILL